MGELALFMPTAAAAKGEGDWGAWAPEWLDAWSLVAHCDFWDRQWMALFARLAKHDTRGEHSPPLLCYAWRMAPRSRCLLCFESPDRQDLACSACVHGESRRTM